jgi:quercetin dioxygenase-like cupin family protein
VDGIVLDTAEIAALEEAPLGRSEGVTHRLLWSDGSSHSGLLELAPGAQLPEHSHTSHTHHLWVIRGGATTLGKLLRPGTYAFVPPGQPHALSADPDEGCEMFYLYLAS